MIKKARDIQLGDRIGGRVVAIKSAGSLHPYLTYFIFADAFNEISMGIDNDTDVWVDDPAPCCKPIFTTVKVSEVKAGDVVCFKMQNVNKSTFDYYSLHWSNDPNDCLVFKEHETVQILKEVPIEP